MNEPFAAVDVIAVKRDRGRIPDEQIDWVIDAYTRGAVADEQMSALAMAILLNGMAPHELARWTAAMIASGERLELSTVDRPTTDKHSTGGVGDKITLPLAPLVAACGAAVPQLSGRGLGHTGGTLDKLESIPGWRATLTNDEFMGQLREVGAVVCAAGDGVKVGTGAFMKDVESARSLASAMVSLGTAHGVRTVALLTDMSTPLGRTAGNALEVAESLEVLAGGGPPDVVELTLTLAREMLSAAGLGDVDPVDALRDGRAMDVWRRMISAQGGDPAAPLPSARERHVVTAPASGVLTRLDALAVGVAAWRLGAGRARKEDPVSPGAGVVLLAKPGDRVQAGQPLLELHADEPERFARAVEALDGGYDIGAAPPSRPLVIERIA